MSTEANEVSQSDNQGVGDQPLVLSPTPWIAKQWQSDEHKYNHEVVDDDGEEVANLCRASDAKLMAASPELLKACMMLSRWASYPGDVPQMLTEAVDAANYAIQKAIDDE